MPFTNRNKIGMRPCSLKRTDLDLDVQDGLALTPAQVAEMTNAGVPISQPNAMQFFDGYKTQDFEPILIDKRYVGLVDIWTAEKDARAKLRKAAQNAYQANQQKGE